MYDVTVVTQPDGLRCTVNGGASANDAIPTTSSASLACVPAYSISGTASGLEGSGLVPDAGRDSVAMAVGASTFALRTPLEIGATFEFLLETQPAGPACTVTDGLGVVTDQAVTEVGVECR